MVAIRSRAHRLYAALFVLLVWTWPLWFFHTAWILGGVSLLNLIVYILVVRYTGSEEQSFWRGLCALAGSFESGCINITFLYIPFVLAYYYVLMILATYVGLRENREWTQEWWINIVSGRFSSEAEYLSYIQPPRWFS